MPQTALAGPPPRLSKSNTVRLGIAFVAAGVFLFNALFYLAVRSHISAGVFGGDAANLALLRLDSYFLSKGEIVNPSRFYSRLYAGKDRPHDTNGDAFVYGRLGEDAREALGRLAAGAGDGRDEEVFIHDFNKSVIEKEITWPNAIAPASLTIKENPAFPKTVNLNLSILGHLYPEFIRHPSLRWQSLRELLGMVPPMTLSVFTATQLTRYAPLTVVYSVMGQFLIQTPIRPASPCP